MPESPTVFDPTYTFTNYGLRIPLPIYTVRSPEVWHGSSKLRLQVEELGNVEVQFIVEPPNLDDYDHLKIAILADLVTTESSPSQAIAILLGCKDRRYKRILTKEHIILSRTTNLTAPEMIFIE